MCRTRKYKAGSSTNEIRSRGWNSLRRRQLNIPVVLMNKGPEVYKFQERFWYSPALGVKVGTVSSGCRACPLEHVSKDLCSIVWNLWSPHLLLWALSWWGILTCVEEKIYLLTWRRLVILRFCENMLHTHDSPTVFPHWSCSAPSPPLVLLCGSWLVLRMWLSEGALAQLQLPEWGYSFQRWVNCDSPWLGKLLAGQEDQVEKGLNLGEVQSVKLPLTNYLT